MKPSTPRGLLALLVAAALPGAASAGAILFDSASNFRETRYDPPRNFAQGDNLVLSIDVVDDATGAPPDGAVVKARNSVTGEVFPLISTPGTAEYYQLIPWSPGRASGEWVVEVQSAAGSATALLPAAGTGTRICVRISPGSSSVLYRPRK